LDGELTHRPFQGVEGFSGSPGRRVWNRPGSISICCPSSAIAGRLRCDAFGFGIHVRLDLRAREHPPIPSRAGASPLGGVITARQSLPSLVARSQMIWWVGSCQSTYRKCHRGADRFRVARWQGGDEAPCFRHASPSRVPNRGPEMPVGEVTIACADGAKHFARKCQVSGHGVWHVRAAPAVVTSSTK
jgi:hypothetical protein